MHAWSAQVYMTMQLLTGLRQGAAALEAAKALRPWRIGDQGLLSTVERTVQVVPCKLPTPSVLNWG
jgi:hypothetical protein